jgi:hypothetical protein
MDTYYEDEEEVLPSRVREGVPLFAFPLEPFDLPNARFQVASRIGKLPFDEDEECSRSLWLVFTGCWGVWTRAAVPIDSRIDVGDPATVAAKCDAIADLLAPRTATDTRSPPWYSAVQAPRSPPGQTGRSFEGSLRPPRHAMPSRGRSA